MTSSFADKILAKVSSFSMIIFLSSSITLRSTSFNDLIGETERCLWGDDYFSRRLIYLYFAYIYDE